LTTALDCAGKEKSEMGKRLVVFPGTFCPPTYGHLEIVKECSEIFPCGLTILSSDNPDKDNWFSQEDCAAMWDAYHLPGNVRIDTLKQMTANQIDFSQLVMIRGIRNDDDFLHEQAVMKLNLERFGINKYFFLMTQGKFRELSSSRARRAAQELKLVDLAECVAPAIAGRLLEYVLQAKNIFLVCGRPGSGKSTWLKQVCQIDRAAYHIDGDELSRELRPHLTTAFPGRDLYQMAMDREEEMLKVLAPIWLELLAVKLRQAPPQSNIYVEAAYGLEPNKRLYRFIGPKVIYVACDKQANHERIKNRGTTQHQPFVDKIPDLTQSVLIAAENDLSLTVIDTSGGLIETNQSAKDFIANLNQ